MMAIRRAIPFLFLVLLLGLAGCSGNDSDDSASQSEATMSGSASADAGESASGLALAPDAQVAGEPREVIYTATMVVRVDDAEGAARRARDLAVAADGYVGQQSADLEGDPEVTLTLRVPASEFDGLVDELDGLGEVLQRNLDSEDVTDQVVDLERRIANARVSADRLRELLAEADGIPNVLAIEAELTKRETEIEVMSGQLQVVRDQVDLSTLTVRFTEDAASDPEVADDLPGFVRAFRAGGVAVVNAGLVLLAVIGFCLPFVPFVAAAWFLRRWYRRRHPKPSKSVVTPQYGWPAGGSGATSPPTPWKPPPPAPGAPHGDRAEAASGEAAAGEAHPDPDTDAGERSDTSSDEA